MLYISVFVVLNIGCISQSSVIRPSEKIYSKRSLEIFPNIARLAEECNNKKDGGGEDPKDCKISIGKSDAKSKASSIAQKAAQEAKAANDAQMTAANAAATQVKLELAEKAFQSARAAEAALAGKQQIFEQLQLENREAESVVQEVDSSLHNTQANAIAANDAIVEARNQLENLKRLVRAFTKNLESMENISTGAQQELAEKTQLLEAAKNRQQTLASQLLKAKNDYEDTKKAAYKATCAAVEAKQKAQRSRRQNNFNRTVNDFKQSNNVV
ncbi:PREDICTED: uncharacterized protein LOC108615769 [Drosophila arizonae]|uniref:Uncharacterized protein LOC108615769 n=1 Tax=Drosophila arizonae TaxID=7263 RepID=A0ABM1PFP9_DROAR|nr:PREDICTED: uncharacterized protein LOC108615769 [Drosophila arizonae]